MAAGVTRLSAVGETIRYGPIPSPFGEMLVASSPRGIVRVAFPEEREDDVLGEIEDALSVGLRSSNMPTEARLIADYFRGRVKRVDLPVDLALVRDGFGRRVLRATSRIPYGSVSSYGDVAAKAGSPRAARAAGNALHGNPVPIVVPCHRVVLAGGGLGGYGGREDRKAFLLRLEGAIGP